MCDCTTDSDVGEGYFSLELGMLNLRGHAHVRSHVSPGMDYTATKQKAGATLIFVDKM